MIRRILKGLVIKDIKDDPEDPKTPGINSNIFIRIHYPGDILTRPFSILWIILSRLKEKSWKYSRYLRILRIILNVLTGLFRILRIILCRVKDTFCKYARCLRILSKVRDLTWKYSMRLRILRIILSRIRDLTWKYSIVIMIILMMYLVNEVVDFAFFTFFITHAFHGSWHQGPQVSEKFLHICSILRHLRLKSTNPCSYGLVVLIAVVFIKKCVLIFYHGFYPSPP